MFGPGTVRTGIDLGTGSVKLVRGDGSPRWTRVTHLGLEEWDPEGSGDDTARAAGGLKRLLTRLGLGRRHLGRIAVAACGDDASVREVAMPVLTETELRAALPYEARKHLALDVTATPVLDCQILGPAPPEEPGGPAQIRVLLAGTPQARRDFPVQVLAKVGLEPEVVDLESLAGLNALLAVAPPTGDEAQGLLDLGGKQAHLYLTSPAGGLLCRPVGRGAPRLGGSADALPYVEELIASVRETLTFYRGRHRQEIARLHLAGGGALRPDLADHLAKGLDRPVSTLDPLEGLPVPVKAGGPSPADSPRYVIACGLCRWWDGADV